MHNSLTRLIILVALILSPLNVYSVSLLESGGLSQQEVLAAPRSFIDAYKARQVGDVVTVKVIENILTLKRSALTINNDLDSDSRLKYALAMSMTSTLTPDTNDTTNSSTEIALPVNLDKRIQKDIDLNNQEIFTTLVTTLVVEIDPASGNMVLEGSRQILMEGQTKSLYVRGILNPKDLDANNEVPSYKLGNAQVQIIGSGSLSKQRDSGVFRKIIDKLF